MKLNTVSPEEMRRTLYLSKNEDRRFIKSYTVFETVRSEVRKLLNDKSILDISDQDVYLAGVNAWVFDRIFNGPGEYTHPDSHEELSSFDQDFINSGSLYRKKKPERKVVEQKSSFFDIIKRAKDILFTEVDSHLVSSVLTSASQYSDSEIIKDSTFFQDPKNYPMGGWNPKIKSVYTWWVDIALYNSSKEFLIANETYFRDMDTNLAELEYLVRTGNFRQLIDADYYSKLNELLLMLMEGKSYKNQTLRSSRTNKLIAWNSVGNPRSGSIRIGRDVTHGEIYNIPSRGFVGFNLRGEELFMKIRQEVLDRIRAIDVSGYDPDDREEFEHKIRSINEKLDVLCEIGRALDQAWENGPFLMNFIDGDTVIGNTNYANVIGMEGAVKLNEIYSFEERDVMNFRFTQGQQKGHYEHNFTMQLKDGSTPTFPWHRFFVRSDKPNLGSNISFGIGTTTIHQ